MERRRLEIASTTESSVTVLTFTGDLDLGTLNLAKSRLQDEMLPDRRRFVLDLDRVGYIDSSGLGFLIGALKKVREREGDLVIARLNAYMLGIFKLLNLHEVLDVYDDLDAAVRALEGGQAPASRDR